MNQTTLLTNSRSYYRRFYRLVVIAVIIMIAVITGSLLLGDSVRGTLTDRVNERLGKTETVITSGTGFMSDEIMNSPILAKAKGYLLVDGFMSVNDKLIPIYIWGADEIEYGQSEINEPLAKKASISKDNLEGQSIIVHLPSHSLVPSGSLFVTKSYATQMRLEINGVRDIKHGGNLLLKNEQTLPLNVFVCREELCEMMEIDSKINVILSEERVSDEQIAEIWNPSISGISLTDTTLTSERIFIQDEIVKSLNPDVRYFSYLVNDITTDRDTVPYSFVTAMTEWNGTSLSGNDIILADYTAKRLNVNKGDQVGMSYFISDDLKSLKTTARTFVVKDIIPLDDIRKDKLLMTEFPGLSNVETCTDWDSDLPINMDRIKKIDEDYWYDYKQTPKAIVAYDAVIDDWGNSFGTATALKGNWKQTEGGSLIDSKALITTVSPRESGLYAAKHGTDFSSLFMALGFFIILSAILLIQNPLLEMFALRKNEIDLYRQLGFKSKDIKLLLSREAFSVMLLASPIGIIAGILYSGITLWLLGNVWSGATHTEGFALHIDPLTVIIGWAVGIFICAVSLQYIIGKQIKEKS